MRRALVGDSLMCWLKVSLTEFCQLMFWPFIRMGSMSDADLSP